MCTIFITINGKIYGKIIFIKKKIGKKKLDREHIIEDIIYWAKRAYGAKMVPGTSGNISIRDGEKIYISASGVCLGDIEENDIVEMNMQGEILNGLKPSSEKLMHLEIYKRREDVNAVIHIHCPYITSFAVCKKEINEPILPEFVYNFGKVPTAKYHLPSSKELAEEVGNYFAQGYKAVLMQNHGIVGADINLKKTFYGLESIQAYTKTYFAGKFLGKINTLSKQDVEQIKHLGR